MNKKDIIRIKKNANIIKRYYVFNCVEALFNSGYRHNVIAFVLEGVIDRKVHIESTLITNKAYACKIKKNDNGVISYEFKGIRFNNGQVEMVRDSNENILNMEGYTLECIYKLLRRKFTGYLKEYNEMFN